MSTGSQFSDFASMGDTHDNRHVLSVAGHYRSLLPDKLDRVTRLTGFVPSWPLPPRELVPSGSQCRNKPLDDPF